MPDPVCHVPGRNNAIERMVTRLDLRAWLAWLSRHSSKWKISHFSFISMWWGAARPKTLSGGSSGIGRGGIEPSLREPGPGPARV